MFWKILVLSKYLFWSQLSTKLQSGACSMRKWSLLFNLFFEINFILKRLSLSPRLSRGLSLPELQDYFRTKIQNFQLTKLYTYVIFIFLFSLFFRKVPRSHSSGQLSFWPKSVYFRMGRKRKLYWKYRLYLWSWDIGKLKNKIKNKNK